MNTATKVIPFPHQPEAARLIARGLDLKREIHALSEELKDIDLRLFELASFEDGKKTATIQDGPYRAKVQIKEYEMWDQDILSNARAKLGDTTFFSVFKWEFSPKSKKDLDGFLKHAGQDLTGPVLKALTIKPGKPAVSYERVEA